MKTLLLLFILEICFSPIMAQEINSNQAELAEVQTKEGVLTAEKRFYDLHREDANQRINTRPAKSLFISSRKLLWVGSSNYHYFFMIDEKIVGLLPMQGPELWVCYSTTNLTSSANLSSAVKEHESTQVKQMSEDPIRYDHRLNLHVIFGPQPFVNESTWRQLPVPTIEKVTFENNEAVLHLVILRLKYTVTMNASLQIVGATQNGQSVPLHGHILNMLTTEPY